MIRARIAAAALALSVAAFGAASCGSTGGDTLTFQAYAAGPEGLTAGEPYVFDTDLGYTVTLTHATVHIGGVYLNETVPSSVASDTSCYLAGLYVAEVAGGLDVDALDPALQPFPVQGFATADRATTGELWLTGGELEAPSDPTVIVSVEGEAVRGEERFPFQGIVTISDNRKLPPPDDAQPGAKPICKQRVVTPIQVDITPREGGSLVLRVDPAGWFRNVDFDRLEQDGDLFRFRDDSEDPPSRNLYNGIRAQQGVYRLIWED